MLTLMTNLHKNAPSELDFYHVALSFFDGKFCDGSVCQVVNCVDDKNHDRLGADYRSLLTYTQGRSAYKGLFEVHLKMLKNVLWNF